VTGTLGLFSLVDLFQLLASSSRTGRLAVEHPNGKARVYFDKGRVVHAEFASVVGDEAVYALFADERGSFEFQIGLPSPEETVSTSTENLMLEAIRRLDENLRESSTVPDDAVVMIADSVSVTDPLNLQAMEVALLRHIDGNLSVAQLADQAEMDISEVKRLVDRLVKSGVLKLREKKARTARLVVQLSRQELPLGVVGIDPNILSSWEKTLNRPIDSVACRREDGQVFSFRVMPVSQAGPHILFSRATMTKAGLSVNAPLLVKPPSKQ
jgi:DNA-binding MarR family transcriptional regulator